MLKVKKHNLVISAVGDESLHPCWSPASDFDLYLIYYGDDENFKPPASLVEHKKGAKYNLFYDVIKEHPEIMAYEYIWMPDDDIYLDGKEISRLFQIAKQYDLWICQPSLIGWYSLKVTRHQPECILRYTNYVEIMCPCFSTKVLATCLPTFQENKSGWGIDHVWNKLLNYPKDKIAVIDDIVAIHTRRVGYGDMYKNNIGRFDQAQKEFGLVRQKYDMKDLYNIVEYGRIHKEAEQKLWPPSPVMKRLCEEIRSSHERNSY